LSDERYIHPVTILSTLPSAGVGALLALLCWKTALSIMAIIGIILLIGIVKSKRSREHHPGLVTEPQRGSRPIV